jgi:Zn-dependent M28 family amino/carboxypeptidase
LGLNFGTLGGPVGTIPVVSTTFAIGTDLATPPTPPTPPPSATGSITTSTISETRTTSNVIAESQDGDPTNVVMAGAHLDSVPAGPGIQDNGSGSAALIEIAEQMAKVKPVNKVRFAWWGAEELGLVGSIDYILSLTDEEHANIALYLNFDMIGSPNFARFVYDGDNSDGGNTIFVPPESAVIEQLFLDYYASQGLPNQGTLLGQRSDHFAFCVTGIPCGGLFTGAEGIKTVDEAALYGGTAGDQYDPCYHTACDTFANVSLTALDQNSDAAAFAILTFAMNTESVNGTPGKGNFKPQNQLKSL